MFSVNVEFHELNGVYSINFHFGQICFSSSRNIHIFTLYDFHGEVSLCCMRIQLFTSFFLFPSPFLLLSTGHFITHLLTNDPSSKSEISFCIWPLTSEQSLTHSAWTQLTSPPFSVSVSYSLWEHLFYDYDWMFRCLSNL